jgi:3-deoxy-D-manno-octulosonic acid kinase
VEGAGAEAFAWQSALPWLEEALADLGSGSLEARTLHAWAAARGVEVASGGLVGRAPVHAVPAPVSGPDGREAWAVRRYRRGGLAAPLFGERYLLLGQPRPERELVASVLARERGVRTPAVVAGATYREGGPGRPFYRADLVTELVPGAPSLAAALFDADASAPPPERVRALRRAGRLVRTLARAGVVHADLSAGNVLVGPAEEDTWVVDLDRCRVLERATERHPGRDTRVLGARMLRRLERSLAKLGAQTGRPLAGVEWVALREGYAEEP